MIIIEAVLCLIIHPTEVSTDDEQALFFENHTPLLLQLITETFAVRKGTPPPAGVLEFDHPVPADKKTYMKTKEAVPLLDIVHKLITHKSAIVTTPNSPLYRVKDIGAIQVHQFVSRSHSRAEKILDRCLHPANKLSLRIVAFDLLLYILSLKPAVRLRLTRSSFPCLLMPIVRLLSFSIVSLPSVSSSARSVAPTLGRRALSLSVRPCPFVRFRFAR